MTFRTILYLATASWLGLIGLVALAMALAGAL